VAITLSCISQRIAFHQFNDSIPRIRESRRVVRTERRASLRVALCLPYDTEKIIGRATAPVEPADVAVSALERLCTSRREKQ
ncbi:hypothetical protein PENTCL1PPCAC_4988, partial [Pristionchus entomophagus]